MKRIITSSLLMILSLYTALANEPDSMYIHLKGEDGVSIVAYALANVDSIVYYASEESTVPSSDITVTDIDGNTYGAVQIGDQVWMSENLKVTKYPDGTSIPYIADTDAWADLSEDNTSDAYCYFGNDVNSDYGALYNYAAAIGDDWAKDNKDNQGVCPDGWHLPSSADWSILEKHLANAGHDGTEGDALKSTYGWDSDGNGTDDYGFSALPGGYRTHYSSFLRKGENGIWMSNDESGTFPVRKLTYDGTGISRISAGKKWGLSIRCLKDLEVVEIAGPTDIDGNHYGAVEIGTQVWMSENLKVTKYPDGASIPYVTDNDTWGALSDDNTSDAYCYYDNDASSAYGALYSYTAAVGVCPTGWHLPSVGEWGTLTSYLAVTGDGSTGDILKSISGWNSDGNGTDVSRFSALPGGSRNSDNGTFNFAGYLGNWWCNDNVGNYFSISYTSDYFSDSYNKSGGFSVRCLKD